jgi:hypothetical protein
MAMNSEHLEAYGSQLEINVAVPHVGGTKHNVMINFLLCLFLGMVGILTGFLLFLYLAIFR